MADFDYMFTNHTTAQNTHKQKYRQLQRKERERERERERTKADILSIDLNSLGEVEKQKK